VKRIALFLAMASIAWGQVVSPRPITYDRQTLSAAQKEQARKNIGIGRVIYTSESCVSDSNLEIGTAATGTDQTAKLQAILDKAADGPLLVIWDGKYTTSKLRVRGNTHIQAFPGCGAILKNAADTILLENYNMSLAVGSTVVPGADANITVEGLTLNGNRLNQTTRSNATDGWIVTMRFVGVKNLTVNGCRILTTNCFSSQVANCENVLFSDNFIDTDQNSMVQNQDGLHFHGPLRNYVIRNYSGFAADDIVSIVANDIGVRGPDQPQNMLGTLGQPYGDITDGLIDGLILKNSNYGIRLLSSTSRIDRLHIQNVTGYTRYHHWLIIGANIPEYGNPTGRGNFGTISVSDCSAAVNDPIADEFIQLDGRIDTVIFRNIKRHATAVAGGYPTTIPTWRIESGAVIGNLVVEGYSYSIKNDRYYRSTPTFTGTPPVHIENNGSIGKLDLINPSITRHWSGTADGTLVKNLGTIRILNKSGVVGVHLANVVSDNAPTVTNAHTTDYLPSPTTVWSTGTLNMYAATLEGGYMDDAWDESSLYLHFPYSQTEHAVRAGTDAFSGNLKVSARLQFLNVPVSGTLGIFARGTGHNATTCNTGYAVLMYAPDANTVAFRLAYGGFSSNYIGGDHVITTPATIPYDVQLVCNGSTISAYAQRSTDGFYLTSANGWSATVQPFATGTNATYSGAGQVGIVNWQSNPTVGAKRSVQDFTVTAP
jgi:hypothetical protein